MSLRLNKDIVAYSFVKKKHFYIRKRYFNLAYKDIYAHSMYVFEKYRGKHIAPYFKIISWDIAVNKSNMPVLIEYNPYKQGIDIQMATGPLFGKFTDEILDMGLKPY